MRKKQNNKSKGVVLERPEVESGVAVVKCER